MAMEMKKPETNVNGGGVNAFPKPMQANKPDPEPLQKQKGDWFSDRGIRVVVRSLSELLEDEKPKKVLIATGPNPLFCTMHYDKMLGFEPFSCPRGDYPSEEESYRGVASMVASACSGSGGRIEVTHVRKLEGSMEPSKEPDAPVPFEKFGEALKTQDADLVLHVPGCLCCYSKEMHRELIKKFGNGKVFILTPSLDNTAQNWRKIESAARENLLVGGAAVDYAEASRRLMAATFGEGPESIATDECLIKQLEGMLREQARDQQKGIELQKYLEKAFFVI